MISQEKIDQMMQSLKEMKAAKEQEIEEQRVKWLGRKGEITRLFEEFRTVSPELKKEYGQKLNALKVAAQERIDAMLRYMQTDNQCRSRQLLRYFGETDSHDCGRCDVCTS